MQVFSSETTTSAALFVLAGVCFGAEPQARLQKDHPELYSSFFFFVEDFSKWLDARVTQIPANKTKLMQSAARYLKVDPSELPKLTAFCRSVAATLRQIGGDGQKYWDGEQKLQHSPDAEKMRQFSVKRQAAIQAGIDQLKNQLSKASWDGVYAHINGKHRASIRLLPATTTASATPRP